MSEDRRAAIGRCGRSAVVAALLVSTPTAALAEPSAAFPPEAPAASTAPLPAKPAQQSPAQARRASVQPPVYARRPVYSQPQPLYYPPPAPSLPLVGFSSDTPHTRFAIELDQGRHVLGWCRNACWMYLRPGRYRVEVAGAGGVAAGQRTFRIEGPALVGVSPSSQTAGWTWLGFGLGSTVLLIVGVFATLGYVGNHDDEGEDPTPPAWMPVTALTGLVMTPLSWIMFGRTSKPGVNVEARSR